MAAMSTNVISKVSWLRQSVEHHHVEVTDENMFRHLQTDLIEHRWTLASNEDNA
jgi:hypothetical protein